MGMKRDSSTSYRVSNSNVNLWLFQHLNVTKQEEGKNILKHLCTYKVLQKRRGHYNLLHLKTNYKIQAYVQREEEKKSAKFHKINNKHDHR